MDNPEEGMWKFCPEAFEDCVECVESLLLLLLLFGATEVSMEGNGVGPVSNEGGGGVSVWARGDALYEWCSRETDDG